ncbi:type 1 glutamine amidotransferase [Dietzia kunjamensis]|uniref:type 1 glutamine amidotransferase n=1 Tax=Dietzia kunjamensis TaxID=322509 RepID=UPI0032B01711
MKPIAIISHAAETGPGRLAEVADRRGLPTALYELHRGDSLPPLEEISAVVALGGPQSAYRVDEHPYLLEEEDYLRGAVEQRTPVLAICLGSQVLARALGGTAEPGATGLEAGVIDVEALPGGHGFSGRYLSFHSDAAVPPPDAEILATSDRYTQAWRSGSALAIQFHPEMTRDGMDTLLRLETEKLETYGIDVAEVQREVHEYFDHDSHFAFTLLNQWFDSWGAPSSPVEPVTSRPTHSLTKETLDD